MVLGTGGSRSKEDKVTSEQLDFGALDEMTGILLQRSFYTATRYFYKCMGKDFKPGFYTTLSLLERNPGITQKALADSIRRDASTLVPFLNQMEKKGWIVRKRSLTDKRAHELYLTESGLEMAACFDEKVYALEALIERELGLMDSKQLKVLLRKFEAVFDNLPNPDEFD